MWAAIFAAIEAIPAVLKLVQSAINEWQLYQLSRIDVQYSDKAKQRKAILSILQKTKVTDEERMACIRLLYDLRNGELPD